MQAEAAAFIVLAEPLVTKAGGDTVRAKQRREQVTLRMAVAAALAKNLGRRTRHRNQLEISRVFDFIADPLETTPRTFHGIGKGGAQKPSAGNNVGMLPVDDLS